MRSTDQDNSVMAGGRAGLMVLNMHEIEASEQRNVLRPSTPTLPFLAWNGSEIRSSDGMRPSMWRSPRNSPKGMSSPQHDTILVTEFAFLHASFAPPYPLAPNGVVIEEKGNYGIEGEEFAQTNYGTRMLSFDDCHLRDSVQQLVWEIQHETAEEHGDEDRCFSNWTMETPLVDEKMMEEEMPERELHVSSSVRNLVLNLRRDCERHSLQPTTVDGLFDRYQSNRRRGYSNPLEYRASPRQHNYVESPSSGASSPVDFEPTTSRNEFLPRLVSNVAQSLRRLSLMKNTRAAHGSVNDTDAIDGARWKIVELAFRFGGPHRYYLVQAVNMFYPLQKFGRKGYPHPTRLLCHQYGTLQWQHKRGGYSVPVDLALVESILDGRSTAVFQKHKKYSKRNEACSLSIVFVNRTLDLETTSEDHRDWLSSALRTLVSYAKKQRRAEAVVVMEEETKNRAPIIA